MDRYHLGLASQSNQRAEWLAPLRCVQFSVLLVEKPVAPTAQPHEATCHFQHTECFFIPPGLCTGCVPSAFPSRLTCKLHVLHESAGADMYHSYMKLKALSVKSKELLSPLLFNICLENLALVLGHETETEIRSTNIGKEEIIRCYNYIHRKSRRIN